MSFHSTLNPQPLAVMPWSAGDENHIFHYSASTHSRYFRPIKDWVALFATGIFFAVAIYGLLLAMAMYPIP